MHRFSRQLLALATSFSLLFATLPAANAAMVDNSTLFGHSQMDEQRQQLKQLLARDDVRDQLLALGADPATLDQRINHLTTDELAAINGKLEELPAGSGVLGIALVVFIVFVVTDVIGATDIFPFIHPVKH
ncbi:DUF6627 family protein [Motiliproteus sediminis]|uniref:DUF6627 family protein n=1 Tax=Motiliproteus sediminis TaxID=1468178 RepID=UPI001AF0245F|nr:DUF6627 family protein [Motiliproteus sediminis]